MPNLKFHELLLEGGEGDAVSLLDLGASGGNNCMLLLIFLFIYCEVCFFLECLE